MVSLLGRRDGLPAPQLPQLFHIQIPIAGFSHRHNELVIAVNFLNREVRREPFEGPDAFSPHTGEVNDLISKVCARVAVGLSRVFFLKA